VAALRFAVLASGGGSNFQAVLDRIKAKDLIALPVFVAGNNSQAQVLERARKAGIPAYHISSKTEGSEAAVTARLMGLLEEYSPDLLMLAGYMKKVPEVLLHRMKNRVLNIHPALLPAFGGEGFYGHKVHEAVVKRGCQFTGLTIHMVNEEYDAGQIVLQRTVAVLPDMDADGVAAAVMAKEQDSYWRVLKGFAEGKIVSTGSSDPAQAVRIDPEWLQGIRELDGRVS